MKPKASNREWRIAYRLYNKDVTVFGTTFAHAQTLASALSDFNQHNTLSKLKSIVDLQVYLADRSKFDTRWLLQDDQTSLTMIQHYLKTHGGQ